MAAREGKFLLNRTAVLVKLKAPFLDWLHEADPTSHKLALQDSVLEPSVHLIPECKTSEGVTELLQEFCKDIFVDQLDGWYRDEPTWPEDRSFEVFSRWFEV